MARMTVADGDEIDAELLNHFEDQGIHTFATIADRDAAYTTDSPPVDGETVRVGTADSRTTYYWNADDSIWQTDSGGGGGGLTNEQVRDLVGNLLIAGTNVTIDVDDANDTITINATGGGGGGLSAEAVRDLMGATLVAGANITITPDDANDRITITASIPTANIDARIAGFARANNPTGQIGENRIPSSITRNSDLADVAASGQYNDLIGRPSLFSGAYSDLSGLPSLLTAEDVRDTIGVALVGGNNVTIDVDDSGNTITINSTAAGGGGLDAEQVRDTIAAALVGGTNVTITPNDAANTITIAATAPAGLTVEQVRDTIAAALVGGTNVTIDVDDANDTITINSTAAGGTGLTAEEVRDTIGATLVGGTNVTIDVDDANNTITINSTATGGGTQVQSDWDEDDNTSPAFIENKPELATGSYVTQETWEENPHSAPRGWAFNMGNGRDGVDGGLVLGTPATIEKIGVNLIAASSGINTYEIGLFIDPTTNYNGQSSGEQPDATVITTTPTANTSQIQESLELAAPLSLAADQRLQVDVINSWSGSNPNTANPGTGGTNTAGTITVEFKRSIEVESSPGTGGEDNVNADWNETDPNEDSYIENKPDLFSGDYNDLDNLPTLFSGDYDDLTDKPTLFSGNYDDLSGKPTLFSGNYNDLSNRPTILDSEQVRDLVAAILVAGTNVTIDVDDANDTITISSTGGGQGGGLTAEEVRDTIGTALTEGSGISITVDDANDTITIASTAVTGTYVSQETWENSSNDNERGWKWDLGNGRGGQDGGVVFGSAAKVKNVNVNFIPSSAATVTYEVGIFLNPTDDYDGTASGAQPDATARTTWATTGVTRDHVVETIEIDPPLEIAAGDRLQVDLINSWNVTPEPATVTPSTSGTNPAGTITLEFEREIMVPDNPNQGSGEANVNADWNETDPNEDSYIENKPDLFSGDYDDLTNKPTLFSGDYDDLTDKPDLFDGTYDSLTGKPTIYTLEAIRDEIAGMFREGANITIAVDDTNNTITISGAGGGGTGLDAEAVRDVVGDLIQAGNHINVSESDALDRITISVIGFATVATTGSYNDLSNTPTVPTMESIRDEIAGMFREGANITIAIDDANDTITISGSGGGGGLTAEQVRDTIGAALTEGANIDITVDDVNDTFTIAVTGVESWALTGGGTIPLAKIEGGTPSTQTVRVGWLAGTTVAASDLTGASSASGQTGTPFAFPTAVGGSDQRRYGLWVAGNRDDVRKALLGVDDLFSDDLTRGTYTTLTISGELGTAWAPGNNVAVAAYEGQPLTVTLNPEGLDQHIDNLVREVVEQSDWGESDSAELSFIKNKPDLFDGAYDSLTGKPTLFSGDYNDLDNLPDLSGSGLSEEQVNDRIGAVVQAGNGLSKVIDDAGNTVTLALNSGAANIAIKSYAVEGWQYYGDGAAGMGTSWTPNADRSTVGFIAPRAGKITRIGVGIYISSGSVTTPLTARAQVTAGGVSAYLDLPSSSQGVSQFFGADVLSSELTVAAGDGVTVSVPAIWETSAGYSDGYVSGFGHAAAGAITLLFEFEDTYSLIGNREPTAYWWMHGQTVRWDGESVPFTGDWDTVLDRAALRWRATAPDEDYDSFASSVSNNIWIAPSSVSSLSDVPTPAQSVFTLPPGRYDLEARVLYGADRVNYDLDASLRKIASGTDDIVISKSFGRQFNADNRSAVQVLQTDLVVDGTEQLYFDVTSDPQTGSRQLLGGYMRITKKA